MAERGDLEWPKATGSLLYPCPYENLSHRVENTVDFGEHNQRKIRDRMEGGKTSVGVEE